MENTWENNYKDFQFDFVFFRDAITKSDDIENFTKKVAILQALISAL